MFAQRFVSFTTITCLTLALVYAAKISPVPSTTSDALRIARGKYLVAFAVSKPLSGSDMEAMHAYRMTLTRAKKNVIASAVPELINSTTPKKEIR